MCSYTPLGTGKAFANERALRNFRKIPRIQPQEILDFHGGGVIDVRRTSE
ncbi:MAG: hypothetical protein V1739_04675 [Candidatus Omnitrophota bacterium]